MRSDRAHFKERLDHAINMLRLGDHLPPAVLAGRLLDIGCGVGNGVAAAAHLGAALAVGVDRSFAEFGHAFAVAEFPELCAGFGVDPRRTLLIEGDLFAIRFAPRSFDGVIMLDAIEHVPDPAAFVTYAHGVLDAGGYFLVDACPLYYSMVGHHLWDHFPAERYPWVHLWRDFEALLAEKVVDAWSLDRFRELNRITHDELRALFVAAGFEIVAERRAGADDDKRARLAAVRGRIRPEFLEPEARLFEDWVRLVGVKRG